MKKLINVKKLTKKYVNTKKNNDFLAVDNVNFFIEKGKSMALIGESGSGKTTIARIIDGLEVPTKGIIYYNGIQISGLSLKQMKKYRKKIQFIFQNSIGIFDPKYTIGYSLKEILKNYGIKNSEAVSKVFNMMEKVGLEKVIFYRYPREISGGQRQRANIARALILRPEFVICDEPVSNLDFSNKKQILNLLNDMREEYNLTYLFITHDISIINKICDEVLIMKKGKIIEKTKIYKHYDKDLKHAYSKKLYNSIPNSNPQKRKLGLK
jgi:peptide/nickel transport system ATP-binding protein